MGHAKDEMMRQEELANEAREILIKANAFEECPHGTAISRDDPEAEGRAYAIGTNRVKEGLIDATREEFMAVIKDVIDDTGYFCPSCKKIEDE